MIVTFGKYGDVKDMLYSINPKSSKVITIITGDPGSGKTALATAFMLENMTITRTQVIKYREACSRIEYLNNVKNANFQLPPQKHLVFSSGVKIQKFSPKFQSYDFEPWRIGLSDPRFTTMYFPKNSLRFIDEMQKYFPNQQDLTNGKMPLRVSNEFQKDRHYGIYTLGSVQVGTDINKKLRDISTFILVKNVKLINTKTSVKTIWKTIFFVNHFSYDNYIANNGDESYGEKVIFEYNGNIFLHYNTTECEKEFDEIDNKYCSYDQSYEEIPSLVPPEGYRCKN